MKNVQENEFNIKELPMLCGRSEAEERKYFVYKDKDDPKRLWLVADQPNAADNIYVGYPFDTKSEGFAGSWLKFTTVEGEDIRLQGPWHTNSNALYAATNIDVRNKHNTFVVIGTSIRYEPNSYATIITNIVHKDEAWTISSFDRGEELAKDFANKLGVPVYRYCQSNGGSCSCWEFPNDDRMSWAWNKDLYKWEKK